MDICEYAKTSKAWPLEVARSILKNLNGELPEKGYVLFEIGYAPSGSPHIGTFSEAFRTHVVMKAFEALTGWETRLVCFSDDMDGLKKIPDNLLDDSMLAERLRSQNIDLNEHLQKPLSSIMVWGNNTFADIGNHEMGNWLYDFDFDHELISATEFYSEGQFDEVLLKVLDKYEEIMEVMLPTLREDRRLTYSPFLPISPSTGRVLYVPLTSFDRENGTISFIDEDGAETTLPVTGGAVKLQWKVDFGARWVALGVDFEMYGKDHSTNTIIYDKICRILGGKPPAHYFYEMFLDEDGHKISKSSGNGVSLNKWLFYGSYESLSYFMYKKPMTAKRMNLDVIPKAMDNYDSDLRLYHTQSKEEQLDNPVFHIHRGDVPDAEEHIISFQTLLNLVIVAATKDKSVLWKFIQKAHPTASPKSHPELDEMVGFALAYFSEIVSPSLNYRNAIGGEKSAMTELSKCLRNRDRAMELIHRKNKLYGDGEYPNGFSLNNEKDLQALVFAIGKIHKFDNLREWFCALYEVLLGSPNGPRFGGFIAIYGAEKTAGLIDKALLRET